MAVDEQTPEAQEPGGEQPVEQLAPPVNENYKWYIIHAYSGFERKVRESPSCATARSTPSSASSFQAMCWWRWNWTTISGT